MLSDVYRRRAFRFFRLFGPLARLLRVDGLMDRTGWRPCCPSVVVLSLSLLLFAAFRREKKEPKSDVLVGGVMFFWEAGVLIFFFLCGSLVSCLSGARAPRCSCLS